MKSRSRPPFVPPTRSQTVRQGIVALLREEDFSAREISERLGAPEAEVVEHLEHVREALRRELAVIPARCIHCGFTFRKRRRLKGPGRCPVCRSEHIAEPRFRIAGDVAAGRARG